MPPILNSGSVLHFPMLWGGNLPFSLYQKTVLTYQYSLLVTFPPNASTPPHTHPTAFVSVNVVSGHVYNKMNDEPMQVFGVSSRHPKYPYLINPLSYHVIFRDIGIYVELKQSGMWYEQSTNRENSSPGNISSKESDADIVSATMRVRRRKPRL